MQNLKMELFERQYSAIINNFFPKSIIAGFSKPILSGDIPRDIYSVLSEFSGNFKLPPHLSSLQRESLPAAGREKGEGNSYTIKSAYMNQLHTAVVNYIDREGVYDGDGLFTKKEQLLLIVQTADCMPLIFYDNDAGIIGVVHMGWRPAKAGILDNIKGSLCNFKVLAGVGIRRCCYQVGEEFLKYPEFADFLKKRNKQIFFDPISFVKKNFANVV